MLTCLFYFCLIKQDTILSFDYLGRETKTLKKHFVYSYFPSSVKDT